MGARRNFCNGATSHHDAFPIYLSLSLPSRCFPLLPFPSPPLLSLPSRPPLTPSLLHASPLCPPLSAMKRRNKSSFLDFGSAVGSPSGVGSNTEPRSQTQFRYIWVRKTCLVATILILFFCEPKYCELNRIHPLGLQLSSLLQFARGRHITMSSVGLLSTDNGVVTVFFFSLVL